MLPLKRILCPTDFSEFSIDALYKAAELATQFGADLYVIHIVEVVEPVYGFAPYSGAPIDVESLRKAIFKGAEIELNKLLEGSEFKDITTCALLREGHAAKQIVAAAQEAEVGLIVIATHGQTGWRRLISGSVAERVVRTATCPVLVVPSRKPDDHDDES